MGDSGKRIALIVGAGTEDKSSAAHDVSTMHSWLDNPHLGGCEVTKMLPYCASSDQLRKELLEQISSLNNQDQFIFYFSGHAKLKGDGIYVLQFSKEDYFSFDKLVILLRLYSVRRAILIIDASLSGNIAQRDRKLSKVTLKKTERVLIKKLALPEGIVFLSSSTPTQFSFSVVGERISLFTKLLVEGVESGLDGKKQAGEEIYVGEIVGYINKKLKEEYNQYPQQASAVVQVHGAADRIWISKAGGKSVVQERDNLIVQTELDPVLPQPPHPKTGDALSETHIREKNIVSQSEVKLRELRKKLIKAFNSDELKDLAFDLGLHSDDFPNQRRGMARELIAACRRRGKLTDLLDLVKNERPRINWG